MPDRKPLLSDYPWTDGWVLIGFGARWHLHGRFPWRWRCPAEFRWHLLVRAGIEQRHFFLRVGPFAIERRPYWRSKRPGTRTECLTAPDTEGLAAR